MNDYKRDEPISVLWQRIDHIHLAYLEEDKNSQKLEEKRRLDAAIKRYLEVVQPQEKFIFQMTRKIFHDSIQAKKEDFSCSMTANAWLAISTYAQNLLTQPWRKEFRLVKLYNGFYKHYVEKHLVGGEQMLELMGYQKIDDSLMVFEDPVDPDRLAAISKDTIIASVECEIMLSVYWQVFKHVKDIRWADILFHREKYGGSVEDAIAGLYPPRTANSSNYSYQTPYYHHSYQPLPQTLPYQISNQLLNDARMDLYDSTYYRHPYYNARPSQYVTCPTGQLIEFESATQPQQAYSHPVTQHHRRSSSDHAVSTSAADATYSRRPYRYDWIGVKDLYRSNSQECVGYDPSMSFVHQDPSGNWIPIELNKDAEMNKSSNVDELDDAFKSLWKESGDMKKVTGKKKKKNKEVAKKNSSVGFNTTSLRVNLVPAIGKSANKKWSCKFCTFLNCSLKEVCEICGKSKSNEAEVPLASGGRQCPQCTLVNKRGAVKCDACDTSLKDSPTYI